MKRRTPEPKPLTRKQLSRRAQEQRARRWLILGVVAVAVMVVGVLGWGLLQQYVLMPRKAVATVNGEKITVTDYQALYRFRHWTYDNYIQELQGYAQMLAGSEEDQTELMASLQQEFQQLQLQMMQLDMVVVEQMIEDRIVRQAAESHGITVTEEEIDAQLRREFTSGLEETDEDAEDVFASAYADWIADVTRGAKLTEEQIRDYVAGDLYRIKLEEVITADLPTTAEQVRARHLLVATEEEAQAAMERLLAGESFADVAEEVSTDAGSAVAGGDLGWFPRGFMVSEFEEAAFGTPPGNLSDIVATDYGYHIILVEDYDANRELDPYAFSQLRDRAVNEWLMAQQQTAEIERSFDPSMVPDVG